MRSEKKSSDFTIAPLVGAAGAAVAISVATERLAGNRQTVALGGATVAFALSQATSGATRAFFQGAAIAGLGVAIVELVRYLRQGADPPAARPNAKPAPEPADAGCASEQASPPGAVEHDPSRAAMAEERTPMRALAVAAEVSVPPEAIEHLSTVYKLLAENERQMLWLMNAMGSIAQVTALRTELIRRPPVDAVAFLRHSVLGSADGTRKAAPSRAAVHS